MSYISFETIIQILKIVMEYSNIPWIVKYSFEP